MSRRAGAAATAALMVLRIAGILLVGRPGSPGWISRISFSDTGSYQIAAEDLADGRQDEASYRVPGYPLLILATEGDDCLSLVLLQQAADLATALAMAAAAAPFIGPGASLAAAGLLLALPSGVIFSTRLIPDCWIGLAACLSALLWLRSEKVGMARRLSLAGTAGLVLSAGTMLKPVLLYAPSVYLALSFLPRRAGLGARLTAVAVMALASQTGPLILRSFNRAAFGLDALSTQDAFEPMGRAVMGADYHGMREGGDRFWLFRDSLSALATTGGRLDFEARDSLFREVAMDAVLSNPLGLAVFELTKWPKFFINLDGHQPYLGLTPINRKPVWWTVLTSLMQLPAGIALFAAISSAALRRRLGPLFGLGVAWFVYAALVYGPIASYRYGQIFYWSLAPFVIELFRLCRSRQREAIPAATTAQRNGSA